MSQELTLTEVAKHSTKKDIYVVIHDNVYNVTSFIDEHPGGEEVLLDVAGQDVTDAFEDVGHSDEAREILAGLKLGPLKRLPGDPVPKTATSNKATAGAGGSSGSGGFGVATYTVLLVGGLIAFGAYQYLQSQDKK